jgi:hypothetical protein
MSDSEARAKRIRDRSQRADSLLARYESVITNKEVSATLLGVAKNLLGDVESFLLPRALKPEHADFSDMWFKAAEFQLAQAEEQIRQVGILVTKFGGNIEIVGGSGGSRFVPDRTIMGRGGRGGR